MAFAEQLGSTVRRRGRAVASACAAAVLTGLALPGVAAAAPARNTDSSTPAASTTTRVITLVTGDRVVVRTAANGRQAVAVQPRLPQHHSFDTVRIGGDLYVIPADAVPYLGRSLDLALFDVSALVRDNPDGRTPVRLTFAAGSTPTAPAGVTITGSPNDTTRDGYLTPAG